MIHDFISYLKTVFIESIGIVFTLFELVGIAVFFFPSITEYLGGNDVLARSIGGLIFFTSFLLANFRLYRKTISRLFVQAVMDSYPVTDWDGSGTLAKNLRIDLTSRCKSPVTVREVGYKLRSASQLIPLGPMGNSSLPKTLNESEQFTMHVHRIQLINLNKVEFVYAKDTYDNIHKSAKFPLRKDTGTGPN